MTPTEQGFSYWKPMLFLPQIKPQLQAFMFVNTIDLNNDLRNEYLGLGKDNCVTALIMKPIALA